MSKIKHLIRESFEDNITNVESGMSAYLYQIAEAKLDEMKRDVATIYLGEGKTFRSGEGNKFRDRQSARKQVLAQKEKNLSSKNFDDKIKEDEDLEEGKTFRKGEGDKFKNRRSLRKQVAAKKQDFDNDGNEDDDDR